MNILRHLVIILILNSLIMSGINAQISPGPLHREHAHLEGISNCTQCHSVGNKVTREKCLACHTEIKSNIAEGKGYHASVEVKGKNCAVCHSDHHGRDFKMVNFDSKTFNHDKTGFALKGEHAKQECVACHKPERIRNQNLRQRKNTFLGLNGACLNCHEDYHQSKMTARCNECHNFDSFKNAKAFDHNKTKFPLLGKHQQVTCKECHKTETINGKTFQKFTIQEFDNCNACHNDPHKNRFGQDCKQCHSEVSFHSIKGIGSFDHDKTNYKLVGKHKLVSCKQCHKTANMTDPLRHNHCTDCHTDYHKKQFAVNGVSPDCDKCHSVYGYSPSEYTIERHNTTKFKLDGAHVATACNECHRKQKDWSFRNIGIKCVDCHKNEHKGFISEKYYPNEDCTFCHNTGSWKKVNFDHNKTKFTLKGEHAKQACNACHYRKNENGIVIQQFSGKSMDCSSCHEDNHVQQFAENGKTDCSRCHGFDDWHNSKFDHNTSRFKIDGRHVGVKCKECHKEITNSKGKYIEYKFDNIDCSRCHS